MKQFFVLGRNPKLSRQEIISYLEARQIKFDEIFFEGNLFLATTVQEIQIQKLGGTIQSGKIIFEGEEKELKKFLEKNEIIPSDKFSYAVRGNLEEDFLKEKFKIERKKATLKHGRKRLKFQEGDFQNLANADFTIFFYKDKKTVYLGLVDQEFEYTSIKKRDMEKPVRRSELSISPRLSKILVNLSGAKENDLLLDPFCGVGSILSEALIEEINVYGIDKDEIAISDAKKNLEWLNSKFKISKKYQLEKNDSKNAPYLQFDAIATETPLGELFKKRPNDKEAKEIIQKFESFIIPILYRLRKVKKKNAKIAITFPRIKNFKVDVEKIAKKTDLKISVKPLEESRPGQFISREILVLE